MPMYVIYGLIISITIIAWLFIATILKNKGKTTSQPKVSIDVNAVITALGGKDNIEAVEATTSKISVLVKNTEVVQVEALKTLGATGIVQTNQKISAIFGKVSKALAEAMEAEY